MRVLLCEAAKCLDAGVMSFSTLLSLILGRACSERPGAVKGAPFRRGAGEPLTARTVLETVYDEGKEEFQLDSGF